MKEKNEKKKYIGKKSGKQTYISLKYWKINTKSCVLSNMKTRVFQGNCNLKKVLGNLKNYRKINVKILLTALIITLKENERNFKAINIQLIVKIFFKAIK